ncbi:hypothetical protein Bca52824_063115 [Brassica carinata]|uniref:Uncharacterized protein n=1 Tax=Brassica carinata TaxID=52824 RepID=A0A8X7U6Y9_BRACI|nr:hypothetical protein Bca52824_063115 [Brassica carinata]
MATLLRLDIPTTTFLAFTAPRANTALNHRFASDTRSKATVSVRTKPSPSPFRSSSTVYSDSRLRKSFSAFASASSLAVVGDRRSLRCFH